MLNQSVTQSGVKQRDIKQILHLNHLITESLEPHPQCIYIHIQLQLLATQQKALSPDDKAKTSVFERPR